MSQNDIPVKIFELTTNSVPPFINKIFNESIENANFPADLKLADITPIYNKNNRNNKENYRLVSISPALSKIVEKCLYDQIYKNVDRILSK